MPFNQYALLPLFRNVLRGQYDIGFRCEEYIGLERRIGVAQRIVLSGRNVLDLLHGIIIVNISNSRMRNMRSGRY